MDFTNLRPVEKKVLGALLMLSDANMKVKATKKALATSMGYKASGGIITYAIQSLEMKNYITITNEGEYTVLI